MKTLPPINELDELIKTLEEAYETAKKNNVATDELRPKYTQIQGAIANRRLANALAYFDSTFRLSVLWLGELPIFFGSGEFFSKICSLLEEKLGTKIVFIGYANGYHGYFPDKDAYESRTYEALSSPIAKGELEKLAEAYAELAKNNPSLKGDIVHV